MKRRSGFYECGSDDEAIRRHLAAFYAGNKEAFGFIASYYMPQLKAMARIILDSEHDAEDVVQEALIKAYKALERFRGESKISTWLCRIVINQANDYVASSYKKKTVFLEECCDFERLKCLFSCVPDDIDDAPDRENLLREIDLLPEKYRRVIRLRLSGLSYKQIALLLECSIGTVKSQLARAKSKLREKLSN